MTQDPCPHCGMRYAGHTSRPGGTSPTYACGSRADSLDWDGRQSEACKEIVGLRGQINEMVRHITGFRPTK